MVTPLVSDQQIEAAIQLRQTFDPGMIVDSTLYTLREKLPEIDLKATAIKVATLNTLYSTNLYAIWRMAEHIVQVLNSGQVSGGSTLVEAIAQFEGRYLKSFASKYVHFFCDPSVPIYDYYVVRSLGLARQSKRTQPNSYTEFAGWVMEVAQPHLGPFTLKQIDQYLWLAGMYSWYRARGGSQLSGDINRLFQSSDAAICRQLDLLLRFPQGQGG